MNNIFERLIDVNEAAERYDLTPQAIKSAVKNGKIKENEDCKKFGNSWVFVKANLDIIFRDRLKDEHKSLLGSEKEQLSKIGEKLMRTYKDKFGKEEAVKVCLDMNNFLHDKDKYSFIHMLLEKCLDCGGIDLSDLNYYILDQYYPESCYCILLGMSNGINKESK